MSSHLKNKTFLLRGMLPPDFYEAIATNRKDRGGLKYCTKEMFDLFIIVEKVYLAEVLFGF
jgi:hypothetical protein